MTKILICIYIYGWLVTGHAYIEKASLRDIFISYLVALLWPIGVPGLILRKLIK